MPIFKRTTSLLFFILAGTFLPGLAVSQSTESPQEIQENKDIPARTVKFELNPVQGGSSYDIELISIDRKWKKPHRFTILSSTLRVRLSPGRYKVRTRTLEGDGNAGPWSKWTDFAIQYKPPENIYPRAGDVIQPISTSDEKITFEWPEIPGTYAYLFDLRNSDNTIIERKVLKTYFKAMILPINKKYKWSITPLAHENEEKILGDNLKFNVFEVTQPVVNTTPIVIELEKKNQAYKYEYEILKFISYNETAPSTMFESVLPEFRASLTPGEYEIRVRSIYKDQTKSDWGPPQRFYVPFTSAEPRIPKKDQTFLANHPARSEVPVKWKPVSDAKRYILYVYDNSGKIIQKHDTERTQTVIYLPAGQRYHYHVQAYSYRENERNPPSIGDRTTSFEIKPFVYHQLTTSEEPTDFYGWGQWIGSVINYKSENTDNNSLTTNDIFGGTGQIAVGYWERYTKLGLLVTGELSGFTIAQKTYQYSSYGAHLGKRFLLRDNSRARVWLGWSLKNLPELITRPGTNYLSVQEIEAQGLSIQSNYLKNLSDPYSIYLTASYFNAMGSEKTPNNLDLKSLTSGSLGAFLSRSLGKKYRGRVGYSYRFDSGSYTSSVNNSINKVNISGHYLSLLFEFALREPDDF